MNPIVCVLQYFLIPHKRKIKQALIYLESYQERLNRLPNLNGTLQEYDLQSRALEQSQ